MRRLEVRLNFGIDEEGEQVPTRKVGELAEDGPQIYFEFAPEFLAAPLPFSPYLLPVEPGLKQHMERDFDYLHGVFSDALPDGFGRLVQDRAFESQGLPRERITSLDRLSAVGNSGMGALSFHPIRKPSSAPDADRFLDLDALAAQGMRLLEGSPEDVLPALRIAGGSPGGARPKILAGVHENGTVIAGLTTGMISGLEESLPDGYEPWLIKFAAKEDRAFYGNDSGAVEWAYSEMARAAGLAVPKTQLFATHDGRWFGAKRFDRRASGGKGRLHMHTLGGILHATHRAPSIDYESFLKATLEMTRDYQQALEAFRRMTFNVFAHNRDDHSRNFAFLMDSLGNWTLSPAYDLTFSAGIGGHHTSTIDGESLNPTSEQMLHLAEEVGITGKDAQTVIETVLAAVEKWDEIAREAGLSANTKGRLEKAFRTVQKNASAPAGRSDRARKRKQT